MEDEGGVELSSFPHEGKETEEEGEADKQISSGTQVVESDRPDVEQGMKKRKKKQKKEKSAETPDEGKDGEDTNADAEKNGDEQDGDEKENTEENKQTTEEERGYKWPTTFKGWVMLLLVMPLVTYFKNLFPYPTKFDYGLTFWNPFRYFRKWGGKTFRGSAPVPPNFVLVFLAWLGSFTGIWLVGILQDEYFTDKNYTLLIGSFGASAVLIYAAPTSPLAQPRNLIGGHTVSAIAGILCYYYWPGQPFQATSRAAAVSFAIVGMMLTGTLHPPGAATALIAALGGSGIANTGWLYIPLVMMGAVIMLIVALITNNLAEASQYPVYWW